MSYASEAVNAQAEGIAARTAVQRSSAGIKAPGQTLSIFNGTQALTGSITSISLGTVGASLNFYLTDVNISTDIASGGNTTVQIIAGTTASVVAIGSVHSLAPYVQTAIESQPSAAPGVNLTLLIGSAASTSHIWYNIYGWQE